MLDGEFKRFKGFAVKIVLRDGVLYQRAKTGMPPRRALGTVCNGVGWGEDLLPPPIEHRG